MDRCFFPGSPVMVRDYRGEKKWISGTVLRKLGPVTYHVDVGKGQAWKRHVDQLQHRSSEIQQPADQLRHRGSEIQQPATASAGPTNSSVEDEDFYPFEQDAPPPEEDAPPVGDPPRDPPAERERHYPRRERHHPERCGRPFFW